MSDFSFILPTEITDALFWGSNVPEAEYDAWVGGTGVFAALKQTTRLWVGLAASPNGDVYACVYSGDIYKQAGGTGDFVALGQTTRTWRGMAAAPNGDVYACVSGGDIYKQTGGVGNFVALSQTSRYWHSMAASPNGDVYACVSGGDIYKQTGGTGDFVALGQTTRTWRGMAAAPNGDVYACVHDGDIYKQTGGTGDFVALGQTTRVWYGMAASPNGDVYASVSGGDIYKQTGGTGNFAALSQTSRTWHSMAAAPNGDVYVGIISGDIYKSTYVPSYSMEDQVIKNHVIYESLTNNNKNNDPETDTTNWLEVGPTNRWACYDGTIGNQSTQAESMLYILAPGAIDSVALLNIESTTVDIVEIDNDDNLVTNGTAWTGATGTTQPDDWDKVGTPADYATDDGMIKITTDAANEGCSQTIAVSAATEYQLLGKYKNTADDIAQIAILSFCSATGSVTRANMKLSAVDGAAFVDFSTANVLTDYIPYKSKLTITDSAGKKLIGYIKAQGADVYACVYGGDIYKQADGAGDFVALGQTSRLWVGLAASPNGDVYACVYSGDIYKQAGGTGDFVGLSQTTRDWRGMAVAPNGDVYACVENGDIYKQAGGAGNFVALGQTSRMWYGLAVAPNGDVYASVYGGDIYKQAGGTGDFVALGQTSRYWVGMAAAPNGDVYVCDNGGDIYKQTGGVGNFVALGQTTRNWRGLAVAPNGDVYACVYNGDIYKQAGGTGDFVALGQTSRMWRGMAASPSTTGVIITSTVDGTTYNWATKEEGFNYNDASGYSYEIEYTSDILATTDLASSTVESVFSHVFTTPAGCTSVRISLMGKASGDIVWFDDVILAPTEYSETVTTGASKTDLVKLDLPKHANALLTVKITNTGGTAKVGEIIVGEKTIIGLVEYAPGFGIKSWSTKSVDTYGKITIVKRGYSKWVKAPIRIAAADMDEVARVLSIYKDTPIIWVVNQNYTSMIVYGFYSDFAVVWPHLDYFLCNIELEGLT